ncbi:hypothetical protein ACFYN3_35910 [Streptomyces lavendulae]|uniref:hypothetical protein n=1 Tax=Streptomyces lavendulae TaxID=1914 RepID=UPI0036CACA33
MPTVTDISQRRKAAAGLDAVDRVLREAARLQPTPGFINGDEYGDWYIDAPAKLLKALSALAADRGQDDVAEWLTRMTGPMCLEALPRPGKKTQVCVAAVTAKHMPCSEHAPENGPALGLCNYGVNYYDLYPRLCKGEPVPNSDRCAEHDALCRVVKRNGEVCGNPRCSTPAHRKIREAQKSAVAVPK